MSCMVFCASAAADVMKQRAATTIAIVRCMLIQPSLGPIIGARLFGTRSYPIEIEPDLIDHISIPVRCLCLVDKVPINLDSDDAIYAGAVGVALAGAVLLSKGSLKILRGIARAESEVLPGTVAPRLSLNAAEVASGGKLTAGELEAALPAEYRLGMAMRSPLHDIDRAMRFGNGVQNEVRPFYGELKQAYQPVRQDIKTLGELDTYSSNFWQLKGQVEKTLPGLQKRLNSLADEVGYPRPELVVNWAPGSGRGSFLPSANRLEVNFRELLRPTTKLPEALYHESTHAEQTNLVVKRIADQLNIGASATPAQLAKLRNVLVERTKSEFKDDYLAQVIRLRGGRSLSKVEAERADELALSFAQDSRKGLGYSISKYSTQVDIFKELEGASFSEVYGLYPMQLNSKFLGKVPESVRTAGSQLDQGMKLSPALEQAAKADLRAALAEEISAVHQIRKRNELAYRSFAHEVEAFGMGDMARSWRSFANMN